MAENIGSAEVTIEANFSDFDATVQRRLVAAAKRAGTAAEKELKASGTRAGQGFSDSMGKATSKAASSQKNIDSIRNSIERLEASAVRAGNAQLDANNKVARAEAALAKVKRTTSIVTLDGAEKIIAAEQRVAKAKRDAAAADNTVLKAAEAISAARNKLAAEGSKAGNAFGNELARAASKASSKAGNDSGGFFSRAFRSAASKAIGRGLFSGLLASSAGLITALSPLSTIFTGSAAAVIAFAGALGQASGAALSLGGVLGALGLAVAAVKVGFAGVGDALKEQTKAAAELAANGKVSTATQEKLDAALKNLAPSARAVVKELGAMAPAWQAVQRSVQQQLFAGVAHSLQQLGNTFFPILNQQLGVAAGNLNLFTRGFVDFITRGNRANQISIIFTGLNGILKTLLQAVNPLAAGFLDIFTASLPFAQQLATVLRNIGTDFGLWLGKVADGQGFQNFMNTAMQLAGNLFQLLGNIGSILGSVFGAGASAGAGLLTLLRDITGQLALFLKSAEGKEALASFFGTIGEAGKALSGIFKTLSPLLSGIGSLFQSLQAPIKVLGAALQGVFAQLAGTLGQTLAQLGPFIGQLVTALAPLITVLGGVLSQVIAQLSPVISTFAAALASIIPSLTPLVQILGTVLVGALSNLSQLLVGILPFVAQFVSALLTGLLPIFQALQPVITQLQGQFLLLFQAFLPLLPLLIQLIPPAAQIALALTQILIALTPLITFVVQFATSLITNAIPALTAIIPYVVSFNTALANVLMWVAKIVAAIVNFAVTAVTWFNNFKTQALTAILGFVSGATGALVGFVSRAVSAISSVVSGVVSTLGRLISSGVAVVKSFVSSAVTALSSLIGQAKAVVGRVVDGIVSGFNALKNLGSTLAGYGRAAIDGLIGGLSGALGRVRDIAGQIAGAVTGPVAKLLKIASPSKVMKRMGNDTIQGYVNGIKEKLPAVRTALTNLAAAVPGQVQSAVGKVSSALNSLGTELTSSTRAKLNGFISTTNIGVASIQRAATVVDGKLKTATTNLKNLQQQAQQLSQSVSQAVLQSGNIAQSQDTSFKGLVNTLKTAVTQASTFSKTLAALAKAGLNKTSLQQIAEAGPATGAAIGQSILQAGKAGVNQINTLQTQLQKQAAAAANSAANAIFGQGIQIAQGIVAGLQKQKANLDAQMTRLADVLVRRVLTLLQALKIPGVNSLKIPGFREGGVVGGREQIVRVAEGGRKEAIIPLTKPRRAQQLMDATGLTALALGNGSATKSRTVEVPIHVKGSIVDYDALTAHIEKVFRRYGFKPQLGISMAGGTL